MSKSDSVDGDQLTLASAHGVDETVERLKGLLAQKGIEVFAHVDHAKGAREAGLALRPTHLVIFGNPKAGTPLMQARQTMGLDLPLRVLVWQDEAGKVWLTYHRLEAVARQHGLQEQDEVVKNLGAGLASLVQAAGS